MRTRLIGLSAAATLAGVLAIGPTLATPARATDRAVVVQPGDTLTAIANRYGLSVERIVALNHLPNANRIYAGQQLQLVPAASAPAVPPAPTAAPATGGATHVVRAGEHLTGIARHYGTTITAIVIANQLPNPSFIRVGQQLIIPSASGAPSASAPAAPAAPPATTTAPAVTPPPAAERSHRVAAGEYLIAIARRYGTSVQAIMAANAMSNASFIRAGEVLRIPAAGTIPAQPQPAPATLPPSMAERVQRRDAVRVLIVAEAARFGVPASLALAVAWQESGWQQDVTSSAGAVGVMQLLPATADWVGAGMLQQRIDLHDVQHNVRAGVRLLRHYLDRYHGDRSLALAAYYQGQTAADRHGIYSVTRPYVASILELERLFH